MKATRGRTGPSATPATSGAEAAASAPPRQTMQAMVHRAYGAPADVLRLEEIDRPNIAAGEVLIRVHAAGLDRGTWHVDVLSSVRSERPLAR